MINTPVKWTFPGRYDLILGERRLADLAGQLSSGIKVLDAGCSFGVELFRFSMDYPKSEFFGVDIDSGSIRVANSGKWSISAHFRNFEYGAVMTRHPGFKIVSQYDRAFALEPELIGYYPILRAMQSPENLAFFNSDYECMPFADCSFDAVFAFCCGLNRKTEADFRCGHELMRVLKPGGQLYLNKDTILK